MTIRFDIIETPIIIDYTTVPIIAINDNHQFSNIVRALLRYSDKEYNDDILHCYDDSDKKVKDIEVVLSPHLIDFSSKKIMNSLILKVKSFMQSDVDFVSDINKQYEIIKQRLVNKIIDWSIPFCFESEIDASSLIKYTGLSIRDETSNLTEKLELYISVFGELKFTQVLFFVGLREYLNDEEYITFCKNVLLNQVPIVLIEHTKAQPRINEYSKITYVDELFEEYIIRR